MLLPGGLACLQISCSESLYLGFWSKIAFGDIVLREKSSDVVKVSMRKIVHHQISASLL
jgi:hypothetical protein